MMFSCSRTRKCLVKLCILITVYMNSIILTDNGNNAIGRLNPMFSGFSKKATLQYAFAATDAVTAATATERTS
jgi:hypothetical protein